MITNRINLINFISGYIRNQNLIKTAQERKKANPAPNQPINPYHKKDLKFESPHEFGEYYLENLRKNPNFRDEGHEIEIIIDSRKRLLEKILKADENSETWRKVLRFEQVVLPALKELNESGIFPHSTDKNYEEELLSKIMRIGKEKGFYTGDEFAPPKGLTFLYKRVPMRAALEHLAILQYRMAIGDDLFKKIGISGEGGSDQKVKVLLTDRLMGGAMLVMENVKLPNVKEPSTVVVLPKTIFDDYKRLRSSPYLKNLTNEELLFHVLRNHDLMNLSFTHESRHIYYLDDSTRKIVNLYFNPLTQDQKSVEKLIEFVSETLKRTRSKYKNTPIDEIKSKTTKDFEDYIPQKNFSNLMLEVKMEMATKIKKEDLPSYKDKSLSKDDIETIKKLTFASTLIMTYDSFATSPQSEIIFMINQKSRPYSAMENIAHNASLFQKIQDKLHSIFPSKKIRLNLYDDEHLRMYLEENLGIFLEELRKSKEENTEMAKKLGITGEITNKHKEYAIKDLMHFMKNTVTGKMFLYYLNLLNNLFAVYPINNFKFDTTTGKETYIS